MSFKQFWLLFLITISIVSIVQCSPIPSQNPPNSPEQCLTKVNKMKNILHEIKLEQKRFRNVTIANMELFYEMCIDVTNCIDTIVMPDFLRGLLGIGTMFLKSACDEYGFNVGPFSKCMEKTKFDLTTLKNTTTDQQPRPKCELSNDEFSELQKFVQKECGDEVLKDMMRNEERVKSMLCSDK
ncbi:hypothetical protein CRE_30084 [Caenorhabditis remanei]|uniref:Uncharacterized protein n=1 Tax=Caenorhabditis remanei TaxID=31234 RepID=E3MYC9_CAERE|nr:hypothetical protein CRE_30084 [Caenorhabditis remanei]